MSSPMLIVPVIDLQAGQVVHAVRGDRAHYKPIASALVRGSQPAAVAERLCEHCATATLYVADLDALQGRAPQLDALAALLDALPALELWLDAGYARPGDIAACLRALGAQAAHVRPVLASESLASLGALREAVAAWPGALLSLDSRGGVPLDRAGVWAAAEAWPGRLIAMDLARVGAALGPDVEHLHMLRGRAPAALWVGSGGIRDEADVTRAAASGAHAWLVASALHAGRIAARTPAARAATDCGAHGIAGHSLSRDSGRAEGPAASARPSCTAEPADSPASGGTGFAAH